MWLVHIGHVDGVKIRHARNCRKSRLPELPRHGVDVYCSETRKNTSFSDGDTLAENYERTMSRLEHKTRVVYQVKVQRECEIDIASKVKQKPELLMHPIERHSPLCTSHAVYGERTEATRLHYMVKENETIQYGDIMSMYT